MQTRAKEHAAKNRAVLMYSMAVVRSLQLLKLLPIIIFLRSS